ncbi:MAG: hypothetical protein H7336_14785, partial [Bacteriovorax sp.]|nr:hypothetical protein [Bacteriovorax sp.]
MTICQLQNIIKSILLSSFSVILLSGCAKTPMKEAQADEQIIKALWNKLPPRFAHRDMDDSLITNPFFDIDPMISNFKDKETDNYGIRFFVTNPVESKYLYDFDLYSGKLYREREFCAQDDIWKNYGGDLLTPNFTQGIVPRVYDQNKTPMRIIVISDKESIEPFKENPVRYDTARIMGSVVVDHCENFPCDLPEKWKPAQILVGVSTRDASFSGLNNFSELKNKIDWSYARGILTNMYGYHKLGGKVSPAYRISRELNLKDSLDYFNKTSSKVTAENFSKLNEFRVGCMKLYDSVWEESERIRNLKYGQADGFLKYFKEFYAKNSNEFYECSKLVRPGNIVEDHRRLWFFSYLQAFTLLEKNGFYYSCFDNAWAVNARVDDTHLFVDQNKELARCRAKNFETTFDQAINGMSLMKNLTNSQYRFVEYDTVKGGSHQKIYGWIHQKEQNYACKYASKTPKQIPFDVFPQDVAWEYFKQDGASLVK